MRGPVLASFLVSAFASGAFFVAFFDPPEHHGVDEVCKAFPTPQYPRPLTYAVRLHDGQPLATGGCA